MSKLKLTLGMFVVGALTHATNAAADVVVYNATQSKMKVDVTLPNGEVKSGTIDEAVDSLDSDAWTFGAGVNSVKVAIEDDSGTKVWSGTLGSNDTGVIISAGKGAKFVPSGTYSGTSGIPKAVALLNVTGDSITLDLVGRNGLGAHRGLVMSTTGYDPKQVQKLDPRESTFGIRLTVKGKEPADIEGIVSPERYYLLWKRSRDQQYRMTSLGYLPPTPKK